MVAIPGPEEIVQVNQKALAGKFNIRRCLVHQLLVLVFFYVLLLPTVGMPFYRACLFFPVKGGADEEAVAFVSSLNDRYHVTKTDITVNAPDGNVVSGWYFHLPSSHKIVLISHGNGGNISSRLPLIATLIDSGASVFIYDYEGFGQSTGDSTWENTGRDGLAVYDYIDHQLKYKPDDIIVMGESFGTAITGYIAQQRPVGGIVLGAGMTSLIAAGRDELFWLKFYPDWTFPQPHYDNLRLASGKHAPLLIIHGTSDQTMPVRYSRELYEKAVEPKQLLILPGAGHGVLCEDQYSTAIEGAIRELISKT